MQIVLTTCPVNESENIREEILKEKLAACALSIPMNESRFWWKGKIGSEKENLMVFKTKDALSDRLFKRVRELHPYEVPFIAILDVKKVNEKFEEWLDKNTID